MSSHFLAAVIGRCGGHGNTHPWHELHEDGELPLLQVPQAAVILDDALVTQVLQQLDLTLQSVDFLRRRSQGDVNVSQQEGPSSGASLPLTLLVSWQSGSKGTCLAASSRPVSAS